MHTYLSPIHGMDSGFSRPYCKAVEALQARLHPATVAVERLRRVLLLSVPVRQTYLPAIFTTARALPSTSRTVLWLRLASSMNPFAVGRFSALPALQMVIARGPSTCRGVTPAFYEPQHCPALVMPFPHLRDNHGRTLK